MNVKYIIAGSIILVLVWYLGAADSITTTIESSHATFTHHCSDQTGPDLQHLPLYRRPGKPLQEPGNRKGSGQGRKNHQQRDHRGR